MGTRGIKIINLDVKELIKLLNQALADEWLAYYQYWVSAQIVKGPMSGVARAELTEHAADELKHANMLSERIIQLGGVPITNPDEWNKVANCKYLNPTNPEIMAILKQGIAGEQCAIGVYSTLLEKTKDKDVITYHMLLSILEDEVEHEEDFEALLEDLQ